MNYQQLNIRLAPGFEPVRQTDGSYLAPAMVVITSEPDLACYPDGREERVRNIGAQIDGYRIYSEVWRLGKSVLTLHLKEPEREGEAIIWFPALFRQAVAALTAHPDQHYLTGHYESGVLTVTPVMGDTDQKEK